MKEMDLFRKGLIRGKGKAGDLQFVKAWLRILGFPMNGKRAPRTFSSEGLVLHFFSSGFLSDGRHQSRIFTGFQGKKIPINC